MANIREDESVEKRRYSRIDCHIPCKFKLSSAVNDVQLKGCIRNISAGGALLEIPLKKAVEININDIIYIEFTLELSYETMFVESRGIIVHNASNKFGVMFSAISDDVKERILDYSGD